MYDKNWLFA
ncbi:Protein of unknown function [Lactobacillus acidophilus DSM 20079 = JCM 1132 = NBRC 13951 = CIP 76.13]|nr:Protein of unknown function [Lactobacillus acidophilus DSM 20079 = JCM 1132 = NBRC 13951 = CIP 76.13]CDF70013.1 Protein of unknown function [Lactobacillus acidophilus CIRM-BIA 442]CDF71807.1 Protein of unknown function [Lactobacillus acidophilus CIRM-BIA 445]CDF75629.1 Protein of unknown function [Lactobacillus acidophilus DSM 20242]